MEEKGNRASEIVQSCSKLSQIKWEPTPYILKPWIVRDSYHIISGYTGFRKSWFALWLAKKILSSTSKDVIFYIDLENPKLEVRDRYRTLKEFPDERLFYWAAWKDVEHKPPQGITLLSRAQDYIAIAEKFHPVMIFDTMNRFHSKDENASKEMQQVSDFFKCLTMNFNATVVVLHQDAKPYEGKLTNYRGSSEIPAGADIHWAITNLYDYSEGAVLEFTCPKHRYIRIEKNIYLFFDHKEGEFIELDSPSEKSIENYRDSLTIQTILLDYPGLSYSQLEAKLNGKMGHSKLQRLLEEGKNRYWSVTVEDDGRHCYHVLS